MLQVLASALCLLSTASAARIKMSGSRPLSSSTTQQRDHANLKGLEAGEEHQPSTPLARTPWLGLNAWPIEPHPEALMEKDVSENSRMDWVSDEKRCINEYTVQFKLSSMHSFLTVPTCSPRRLAHMQPSLYKCGTCDKGHDAGAEIHWNIPTCTEALCVWPKGTVGDAITIGPPEGIQMHPKCAWKIIQELDAVYRFPWRAASFGGVFRALGEETWKPSNWGKVFGAGITGGFAKLAEEAAATVNWKKRLNTNCEDARSKEEVLKKPPVRVNNKTGEQRVEPIGAVCWNNIIDFRDMWCYLKDQINVNEEADCDAFHF